jgi:acyl carrier protein|tara:strand:- start:1796 stop:2032 length:237 start_codon:yes stop_codon:yes gene_type:complete
MEQLKKYNLAFVEIIGVTNEQLPGLVYQATTGWDSVGHMQLMTQLEDVFGIALEMDDILDFSSYEKGMDIMRKYGVTL